MELQGFKVVHALPGRVRLQVAKFKGNPALARQAQGKLAKVPGITQVEAKPGTGSLLIQYDQDKLLSTASLEVLSETLGETLSRNRSPHPGHRVGLSGGESRRRDRAAGGRQPDRFP